MLGRMASRPTGVLLTQLGTPASTEVADVRAYLREFLSDPRVIDIPAPARWLLLNAVILPFRPRRSAEAYRAIWTPEGSPLLVHSRALAEALGKTLGEGFRVELGMRYGEPRLADALERLLAADVEHVVALPLFPQYAASSTGSALERLHALAGARWNVPPLSTVGAFFDDPGFVAAVAERARPALERFQADHVLFSYHGLPERQIRRSDETGVHCLADPGCCDALVPANRSCYRAQCFATSRALAAALALPAERCTTSFQSRLGRTPWIRPYTDLVLPELADRGMRRLLVLCPSFVADCLETLEEIGIRARAQWRELGGEALELVPCVNASDPWVAAAADLVRAHAPGR
jgi:ferrochelatase